MTTQTMTLTEFLLARIDEDEVAARAGISSQADPENGWGYGGFGSPKALTPHVGIIHEKVQAQHIIRWHPARVLAECAAKRAMIDFAFVNAEKIDGEWGCVHSAAKIRAGDVSEGCYGPEAAAKVLENLASVYADHPDFRVEWA